MGPFDLVNDILLHKKNLLKTADNPQLAEKIYEPYLTNKALSFHHDTILYANEINQFPFLDKKLQFDYYLNSIRSVRRKHCWIKKAKIEDIEVVQQHYQCSVRVAIDYLSILTPQDITTIKRMRGGVNE
jgi:Bacteriophage clamp loader A subunit